MTRKIFLFVMGFFAITSGGMCLLFGLSEIAFEEPVGGPLFTWGGCLGGPALIVLGIAAFLKLHALVKKPRQPVPVSVAGPPAAPTPALQPPPAVAAIPQPPPETPPLEWPAGAPVDLDFEPSAFYQGGETMEQDGPPSELRTLGILLQQILNELRRQGAPRKWEYYWVIVNQTSAAPGFTGTRWEISSNQGKIKGEDVWDYVDDRGKEGWELVSVAPMIAPSALAKHGSHNIGWCLWFKRPVMS